MLVAWIMTGEWLGAATWCGVGGGGAGAGGYLVACGETHGDGHSWLQESPGRTDVVHVTGKQVHCIRTCCEYVLGQQVPAVSSERRGRAV